MSIEMTRRAVGLAAQALDAPEDERDRFIAEGAGATSVAAALAGLAGGKKIVSVVSGGNIDAATLCAILNEKMPECVEL